MSDDTASTRSALTRALLDALGRADNVREVENCMTRLRVDVVDPDVVDVAGLQALGQVIGVVPGPTTQIVLGPGLVDRTADELGAAISGAAPVSSDGSAEDLARPRRGDARGP